MAIIPPVTERSDSPKVSATLNKVTFTRTFNVQSDDKNDGPIQIGTAPGIPELFEPYRFGHEFHQYARVRAIDCERNPPGSTSWVVTCRYETPDPAELNNMSQGAEREKDSGFENPLLMLPVIEFGIEKFQQIVYYVYNKETREIEPFKNSAGAVYDPPPQKDSSRLTLTITRNEPIDAGHPALGVAYTDTTNEDVFWGAAPGQCKCQSILANRETKILPSGSQFPYLKVTYKFEFRPSFDLQILDSGYWYIDSTTGKKLTFTTEDGSPRVGALDGNGHKLEDGETPVFNALRIYLRQPFAALGLPQSFSLVA